MNIEQIKNGEKRIFPFYKGKYLGQSPFGFSNIKSARKLMLLPPRSHVYREYFISEENYKRQNTIFYGLKDESYGHYQYVREQIGLVSKKTNVRDYTTKIKVISKDMTDDEYNNIIKDIENIELHNTGSTKTSHYYNLQEQFEEKYNLYPSACFIDDTAFKKAQTKFINDNVEFKEGVLEVNIKFDDGTTITGKEIMQK